MSLGAGASLLEASDEAEVGFHPFLGDRLGGRPHVERRIEIAGDAFNDDHTLLQQDQLRPRFHVKDLRVGEQLAKQIGHRNVFRRPAVDRLTDRAHGLCELFNRVMRRHVSGFKMDGRCAVIVARDQAVQNLSKEAAFVKPRRPMMPKSTATIVPLSSTNRLP